MWQQAGKGAGRPGTGAVAETFYPDPQAGGREETGPGMENCSISLQ